MIVSDLLRKEVEMDFLTMSEEILTTGMTRILKYLEEVFHSFCFLLSLISNLLQNQCSISENASISQ